MVARPSGVKYRVMSVMSGMWGVAIVLFGFVPLASGYTLEYGTVTGGGAVLDIGTIVVVGQPVVGVVSSDQYTIEVGAAAILWRLSQPQFTLADYAELADCLGGPTTVVTAVCDSVDLDVDGDVDLADFAVFQRRFQP